MQALKRCLPKGKQRSMKERRLQSTGLLRPKEGSRRWQEDKRSNIKMPVSSPSFSPILQLQQHRQAFQSAGAPTTHGYSERLRLCAGCRQPSLATAKAAWGHLCTKGHPTAFPSASTSPKGLQKPEELTPQKGHLLRCLTAQAHGLAHTGHSSGARAPGRTGLQSQRQLSRLRWQDLRSPKQLWKGEGS